MATSVTGLEITGFLLTVYIQHDSCVIALHLSSAVNQYAPYCKYVFEVFCCSCTKIVKAYLKFAIEMKTLFLQ